MDKNKITWIGLGQAGGNVAQIAETKYNYHAICINTSKEDLSSLKGVKYPVWIENGIGAAKDRKSVIRLMSESIDDVVGKINTLVTGDITIVVFSGAGGTGSGSSGFICKYLISQGKIVVPVVILPSSNESAKSHANTYDCLAELSQIDGIGGTFLLDNENVDDKFLINNKFVADIDALLGLNHSSQYGNIDEAEIRTILSCPGISVISRCSKAKSTASDIIHRWHNGIYTKIESNTAMYLGISTSNRSLDTEALVNGFDGIFDTFLGISESTSLAILAGLQWPMKRIDKFKSRFEQVVNTITTNVNKPQSSALQGLPPIQPQLTPSKEPTSPRDILLSLMN
jgi:cell division GTPase FtsZ